MRRVFCCATVVGLTALLLTNPMSGADKSPFPAKGKTRAAETKYLMRGITGPNFGALDTALKEKGPADDKAWDKVVLEAELLNEMGYLIVDDERSPGKEWADAAKILRDNSSKLLDAAKDKKLEDSQAAFKAMSSSCGACHSVYKPKKN
jgi:hypothetical protein